MSDTDDEISDVDDFASKMEKLSKINDQERRHYEMDELMVKKLRELGYSDAMDIFENTPAWYA